MKRLFVSFIVAIACCVGVMAQTSLVATLQHGSNIRAFYGNDALSAAHEAAVDGDVITLSSGKFNGSYISKAITIRGESFSKTSIETGINANIPNGNVHALTIEGIKLPKERIFINGTGGSEKVVISKCYHNQQIIFTNCNATIVQCNIPENVYGYSIEARDNAYVACTNSIIAGLANYSTSYPYPHYTGRFDVQNCIIPRGGLAIEYSSIKNCIINYSGSLDKSNTSSHCLVKGASGFSNSWTVDSWDGIFEEGSVNNGGAWYGYNLTTEATATYLGTDGTTVGIIGGMYPYDETPNYPLVKKLDVNGSHKNGKLNVKIDVE